MQWADIPELVSILDQELDKAVEVELRQLGRKGANKVWQLVDQLYDKGYVLPQA